MQMGAKLKTFQLVSGWDAVELILKCIFVGLWQLINTYMKKMWKGQRRKVSKDFSQVEMTVDSSIGTHCYIKIMGVKYHYVETGPKTGRIVIVFKDAPDSGNSWGPNWANLVRKLAETGYHVITLDLRGTGGSEGGSRRELAPPRAVEELTALLKALGVSEIRPAVVLGFGVGGMLAWYLIHSRGSLVSRFAVMGAPHPNLYWQYPPAPFCKKMLHFIQWPHFPEQWLADGAAQDGDGRWSSTRACDWSGALNYVRGAAWWQIRPGLRTAPPALLVGDKDSAPQLVASAQFCSNSTLRLINKPSPADRELPDMLLEFLIEPSKSKSLEDSPKTLMSRVFGAVADRGRDITSRFVLPPMPVGCIIKA